MQEFDNNMRGVLFQNEKTKDTAPDYKGSCEINKVEYWVSGWKKLSKAGKPFLSLSFQEKQEMEERGDDSAKHEVVLDDDTDYDQKIDLSSIPF